MKNLSKDDLMSINGGHVPTAYYMDRDVIRANGKIIDALGSFFAGFLVGFFD
jgi:bacteriocin-like protein